MHSTRALRIAARLGWVQTPDAPLRIADQLVKAAQQELPVTGVGMAWMNEEIPGALVAATDERARLLEELQFTLGEGPCTRSVDTGRPVVVEDLAQSGQAWPAYTAGALDAGVAAVVAVPLQVGQVTIGVLDLYRDTPGALPDGALDDALAFGTVGTWVLLHLNTALQEGQLTAQLAERLAVYQAAQITAIELALPVRAALNILRARARAEERPLADLAQDLLAPSLSQQ